MKIFLSGRGAFGMFLNQTQPLESASNVHRKASLASKNNWTRISAMKPMRRTQRILFVSLASCVTFLLSTVAGSEPITLDQATHESNTANYGRLAGDPMPQQQSRKLGNDQAAIRGGLLFPFELPGGYGDLLNQITTQNGVVPFGSAVHSPNPVPKPGAVILLGASLVGFSCIAWRRNRKR
jgi:hypothetical protein